MYQLHTEVHVKANPSGITAGIILLEHASRVNASVPNYPDLCYI